MELAPELDANAGRHCGILEVPEGHLGRNLASSWVWCCGVFSHRPNLTRRSEKIEHTACVLFNFEKKNTSRNLQQLQQQQQQQHTHMHT